MILGARTESFLAFLAATFAWGEIAATPKGVKRFPAHNIVNVKPAEPGEKFENSKLTQWEAGYETIQFVQLKSGDIMAPVVSVRRPKFGKTSIVYYLVWETADQPIGSDHSRLYLAKGNDVVKHIILLRRLIKRRQTSEDGFRVWEVEAKDIGDDGGKELLLPRYGQMPLIESRNDARDLMEKYKKAVKYADDISDEAVPVP